MQLVDAEQITAQLDITMHRVHVAVNRVDEVAVHLDGHLGFIERCGERGGVRTRIGEELELLRLRREHRGARVAEPTVTCVEGFERGLAQNAITRHEQRDERTMRHRARRAFGVDGIVEGEVGVVEQREDVVGRRRHLPGTREELLLGGRENMGALAKHRVEEAAVHDQVGLLGVKPLHRLVVKREDLRCEKRRRPAHIHGNRERLRAKPLIAGDARVFIASSLRVLDHTAHGYADLVVKLQELEKASGAARKRPLEGGVARGVGASGLAGGKKRLVVGEQLR